MYTKQNIFFLYLIFMTWQSNIYANQSNRNEIYGIINVEPTLAKFICEIKSQRNMPEMLEFCNALQGKSQKLSYDSVMKALEQLISIIQNKKSEISHVQFSFNLGQLYLLKSKLSAAAKSLNIKKDFELLFLVQPMNKIKRLTDITSNFIVPLVEIAQIKQKNNSLLDKTAQNS